MAVVTRYFSNSAAGAGDGTTWADRAALVSAGTVSTIITSFNFTSDSLLVYIEGGKSYTITTGPTVTNTANFPLMVHGCDSSGNPLDPPDPDWTSDQPEFDASSFPELLATTNIAIWPTTHTYFRCVKLTGSGNTTTSPFGVAQGAEWVACECSSAISNASGAFAPAKAINCWAKCTNATYSTVSASNDITNVRLVGNGSASSGNRRGWTSASAAIRLVRVTSINNVGGNFVSTSTSTGFTVVVGNCVGYGGGTGNLVLPGTASTTTHSLVSRSVLANNGAYGIDFGTNTTPTFVAGNALFDNTSGPFTNAGSLITTQNVTSGAVANEFVDAGNGDFRIKNTSSLWGKGYGVSDQPAAGGGGVIVVGDY